MNDNTKYVAYIVSSKTDQEECHGVGVVIGNNLITAGHVVESADKVFATIKGRTFCLDNSNRVFLQSMDNNDYNPLHNDIAIYCLDNFNSPLVLSDRLPEVGETYTNAYFVEKTIVSDEENIPAIFRESTSISIKQCDSVYEGLIEGNFFACKTEDILKEGNSGCPLMKDYIVYGILHGGMPGDHKCVYQSAQSIRHCFDIINSTITE